VASHQELPANGHEKSGEHWANPLQTASRKEVLNMVVVSRAGFEPAKIPKNRLIYHKPHLSRLAPLSLVSAK